MRIILLFFLTFSVINSSAQKIKKSSNKAVVSATKMNILYKGIDNPISIAVTNHPCSDIFVNVSNGIITGKGCDFSINPNKIGQLYITVMIIKGKDTITMEKKEFRVLSIPSPIATICSRFGKEIEKKYLLNCKGLNLIYENFDFICTDKIIQFNFNLYHNNCLKDKLKSNSSIFSNEILNVLKNVEEGDIVEFENIKIIKPSEKESIINIDTMEEIESNIEKEPIEINDLRLIIK
jgi:hypothetical protein